MKNYALYGCFDKKKFILKYEITGNTDKTKRIVIYFANGDKNIIPYTIENEEKLKKRMIEQVNNTGDLLKELDYNKKKSLGRVAIYSFIMIILSAFSLLSPEFIYGIIPCFLIVAAYNFRVSNIEKLIKDIKKNKYFVEHMQLLNKENINENVLNRVKEKTQNLVTSKGISINDMDQIKFKDLQTLVENIERDQEFAFDYDKPKTYMKK